MEASISPNKKVQSCGVVGLGSMGIPMAEHMKNNGYHVVGFDINEESVEKAKLLGIHAATSIQKLAEEVDLVLIMVQTDQQVKEIILGDNGLINCLKVGSVICIASSISPFTSRELETIVKEKGIGLLDTPVCLGQQAANDGTLTVFVGGEEKWFEHAKETLQSFGKHVIHVGDSGAGQIAKTANNLLLWSCITANYEVLTLAKSLDVDMEKLIAGLMQSSGANWSLSRWGKSTGKWSEKDMDVALELAQQMRVPMPLSGLVDQLVKNLNQEKMKALLQ